MRDPGSSPPITLSSPPPSRWRSARESRQRLRNWALIAHHMPYATSPFWLITLHTSCDLPFLGDARFRTPLTTETDLQHARCALQCTFQVEKDASKVHSDAHLRGSSHRPRANGVLIGAPRVVLMTTGAVVPSAAADARESQP